MSSRSARGPAFVVVRLPDGRRRSIRRSVTDLAAAPAEERGAPKSLPRISVRTLLTLMHHLNSTLTSRNEEVIRDEHPVESAPPSVPVLHRTSCPGHDNASEPLAHLTGGDAEADRTELCATSPADATDRRDAGGGSAC
ncbi:hypothetical protein [Chelativorans sp. ZYF759]|uniref:hypothetical protein n=1 Tax=Chelativorans sp. ZYF759 TaxID=2692213 RepID=UPI0034D4F331